METKFAKVLDNTRRHVVDLKRKKAARMATYLSGVSRAAIPYPLTLKSSSLKLGKRKKPDACKNKCKSCKLASRRSLLRYYTNFMKSSLPKRLMFYQNGKWVDHEAEVAVVVRKEFQCKKAAVELNVNGYHLILDFVHMIQFNVKTSVEQPIAWIDEDGSCFFPEVFSDADNHNGHCHDEIRKDALSPSSLLHGGQEIKLQIEIDLNGLVDHKLVEFCGESSPVVKRIKVGQDAVVEDSCDKVSDVRVRMDEDVGENQHVVKKEDVEVEKAVMDLDSDVVQEMFLKAMNCAGGVDVVNICSNSGSLKQGRLELFLKQAEITKNFRGDPNIRYAWLASSKQASSGIMTYGLGHFGLKQIKSAYGIGVHLTAANCVDTSAKFCDVDENGVRHMVLCRVIMGNMEAVSPGSKQFHPSSENFDSGVDDLQHPRHFVVWSMNMNTHIYPECVVSFKIPSSVEGMNTKTAHHVDTNQSNLGPVKENGSDHQSNLSCEGATSLNSTTARTPKSPHLPFPMLFQALTKLVPPERMKLVNGHYEQFRQKVISREDFVKKLREIAGDDSLRTTIMQLNCKVAAACGKVMVAPGH